MKVLLKLILPTMILTLHLSCQLKAETHIKILKEPTVIQGVPCKGIVHFYRNGVLKDCHLSRVDTISGLEFPADTYVKFRGNGDFLACRLPVSMMIQGIPCQRYVFYLESVYFFENGMLEFCYLSRVDTISGQQLPSGTGVRFKRDGTMDNCCFPRNTVIQGILCRGRGWNTYFHPNGQLSWAYLPKDQVIQGVPCKAATFFGEALFRRKGSAGVRFHPNGILMQCKLAEDFVVEGVAFKKGDILRFTEDGQLALGSRN